MNDIEIEQFITSSEWIFAKTYAKTTPHEYTLFEKSYDKQIYNRFVAHMKLNLVTEPFFRSFFDYFYWGNYKYWTMEQSGEQPILINRALKTNVYDNTSKKP
jgi:hypothetical protein